MSTIDLETTGTATQLVPDPNHSGWINNGAQSPFTLSVLVDGSSVINPDVYRDFVPMTFSLNVGGQIYTASSGEFWGNQCGGCYDTGLVVQTSGGVFSWDWTSSLEPQASTLGGALLQENLTGGVGGLNFQYGLNESTISVVDPPTSVPEPWGCVGVILFALTLWCAIQFAPKGPGDMP